MEIERKFLIDTLPEDISSYPHKEYTQGYLSTEPVVRVRREGDEFFLTYKSKGRLSREEYNLPLNEESFNHLLEKADGIIINKTRYFIPITGTSLTIELDEFHDELSPLILAEVEFESEEEANTFIPPSWFADEVTMSGLYQNSRLSQYGLPND